MSLVTCTGSVELVRQALRRDRVLAPASIGAFVVMAYASAFATDALYHSGAAQLKAITLINDQPGILALYGPVDPNAGVGALAMSKMTVLYALFAAGVFVALVRRHTRVEEESGRAEFLAGTSLGRNAPLLAAVIESSGLAVMLGALCGLAAVVGGLPAAGSFYFAMSWIGTGLVATGIGAVCCQLSASARTCAAIAVGALGALFAIRAVGDATSLHWLDWLSPLGWNTELHAWSQPRAWVLVLYVMLAFTLFVTAQWLRAHRDLDGGILGARRGAVHASASLSGIGSLELRLHRMPLIGWSVAVFGSCALFGAIMPSLNGILKSMGSERLTAELGGSLMVAILSEFAVIVTFFGVMVVIHAASEELIGRADLVLSTSQSRARWLLSSGGLAMGGSAMLMLFGGLGMWSGYGLAGGADAVRALAAAVVWIPAVLVVVGLALALMAYRPSWAPAAWAWPVGFWLLALVPPLLDAPAWIAGLSPYDHVPKVPNAPMDWTAESLLVVAAAGVVVVAWRRFEVRDVG